MKLFSNEKEIMIYENINKNLSNSISTTIENYDRMDSMNDSTHTDEKILEFGQREGWKKLDLTSGRVDIRSPFLPLMLTLWI